MTSKQQTTLAALIWPLFLAATLLPTSAKAAERVTLQLKWFHQFQFAGFYAAREMGYYAEEGLDVTIRQRNPAQKVIPIDNVLKGDAQFGIADTMLIVERLQDSPVVILAAILQHSPLALISLQASGINNPADLKNKRIMFTDDVALLALLAKFNIEMKDIKRVPHNYRADAIFSDDIDAMSAYITSQPLLFEEQGVAINIISPLDYGIDIYGDMLFTSEDYLKSNPEQVLAFRRASLKGWQYALQHPEQVIDWIIERFQSQQSREFLRSEAKVLKQKIDAENIELGHLSAQRLHEIATIYQQMGLVPDTIDLHGLNYLDHFNQTQDSFKPAANGNALP